ncbi:hypothetical protein Amsp01_089340 [Amycolatopsis sp. NBRC 101858]|uniref:TetR/AcrR family transcriptional regulator n=1 Tax=Amycolatopsis sp. NBRC 101858 TaxID=3032200 RepID=UPI0024A3EC1E|nr:TetR/AcrR family transcriptional regulator [Amycolatopsis sp. NBRC 101858]GLY42911.1 hypothetical protein Amsp01_089340 [Amycolatopsis sp. NBRC 101858]
MIEHPEQPAAQRPGGRTARVRAQVLDAAVQLIARRGVAGLRYDEVATLAGVNKTSVYRNWPDREKLVSEALVRLADQQAPIKDTGELRRDLVEFLIALAASLSTPTGRAIVNALQTADDSSEIRATVETYINQRVGTLQQRIGQAVARGELPAVDAYLLAELLSGPVHLYVNRGIRPFTRDEAERVTDIVLAGIRATAS